MKVVQLLSLGLVAGVISGMFGIGGGLIIVPGLMLLVGLTMHRAIGTSLAALLLPVGLLGVMEYYKAGHINIKFAAFVAIGLFIGAYLGAKIVQPLSPLVLKRIYAIFLLFVAGKILIQG